MLIYFPRHSAFKSLRKIAEAARDPDPLARGPKLAQVLDVDRFLTFYACEAMVAHWDGYSAVLMRIPDLERLDRDELRDLVEESWLTRAQKRLAKEWLAKE